MDHSLGADATLDHRDLSVRVARNIEMGPILKQPTAPHTYMSSTMMQLRKVLEDDDSLLFERLCVQSQIFDQDENLMLLYVAAICMNNERAFD